MDTHSNWDHGRGAVVLPLASTKLKGGYTGFTLSVCPSVRLSVCGQIGVGSVCSTILAGSFSYLHILLSNGNHGVEGDILRMQALFYFF